MPYSKKTLKQSHVKEKSQKWIQNMHLIYYNIILIGEHKKLVRIMEHSRQSDNSASFEVHALCTSQIVNIHRVNFALKHCHLHGFAKGQKRVSSKGKHKAHSGQTMCHSRSKQFWGDNGNKSRYLKWGIKRAVDWRRNNVSGRSTAKWWLEFVKVEEQESTLIVHSRTLHCRTWKESWELSCWVIKHVYALV